MKRNYAKEGIDNAPPIGMLPNGELNIVKRGDPPFVPRIIDDEKSKTPKKGVPISPKT